MTHNPYIYIALMAIVTLSIRILPLTLIRKQIKNEFLQVLTDRHIQQDKFIIIIFYFHDFTFKNDPVISPIHQSFFRFWLLHWECWLQNKFKVNTKIPKGFIGGKLFLYLRLLSYFLWDLCHRSGI